MASTDSDHRFEPGAAASYTHDYSGSYTRKVMGARTVADSAAFLLPHLKPGHSLLDLGCGPGSITVGLAEAVSPGQVVGLDIEETQVRAAGELAATRRLSNVSFVLGNAYHLEFESDTFDVVFTNALLGHLSDPVDVLREAFRVLKPGGIIGARFADFGSILWSDPLLQEYTKVVIRFRQHAGGDPLIGRKLRGLLCQAGFENTEGSASCGSSKCTMELTSARLQPLVSEWISPKIREVALGEGWVDLEYLSRVEEAFKCWSESSDAFLAVIRGEAIGWKPT